ncbi:hypothetical protein [Lysobacter gummosus]
MADESVFHASIAAGPEWVLPSSRTSPSVVKQRTTACASWVSASK